MARPRRQFSKEFKSKVTGIEPFYLRPWDIFFKCFGTGRTKEGIVLSPNCQYGRLAIAQVGLPLGVSRDVRLVVAEQVELDFWVLFSQ